MNPKPAEPKEDVICRCSGTTVAQIKRLVGQGVDDLDGLSRATGVCSGCGGCDYEVMEILAECRAASAS